MKIHDCVQGTEKWLQLRVGKPTASEFHRIVTPTGKLSAQADEYCNEILGELMLGRPLDAALSGWMDRGKELEVKAREYYEFTRDVETVTVGFCTTDDELIGCSPDAFVGDDGVLEIKCPKAGTHVGYLLSETGTVARAYMPQVQGQLYVTGRRFVDIVSYHPELPAAIIRVERDEEFQKILHAALQDFLKVLDRRRTILQERGWIKPIGQPIEAFDWLGITDADVNAILASQKGATQ